MSKILFFIFALTSFSCSTTNIKSKNNFPIDFESKDDHTKEVSASVTKQFFLWGLVPKSHDLYVDEAMANRGYDSIGELVVTQKNTTSDIVWTLLSFGMYLPQTYHIQGKSIIK